MSEKIRKMKNTNKCEGTRLRGAAHPLGLTGSRGLALICKNSATWPPSPVYLPLVSRGTLNPKPLYRQGFHRYYYGEPFLHSLMTRGKLYGYASARCSTSGGRAEAIPKGLAFTCRAEATT